jgi:uncharacterized protein YkwD
MPQRLYYLLFIICTFLSANIFAQTQLVDSLNTAKNCRYMKPQEREMIYEINRVRSNPRSYLQYIEPMLNEAQAYLKQYGKGDSNYSVTYTQVTSIAGKYEKYTDTVWHFTREEKVKALTTLVNDLKTLKPLSVLRPDSGIYAAARKHATDNTKHRWKLMHTGSDGSHPWDRIKKYSPAMRFGNENIAGNSENPPARDIVIQLLVDAGIPGYGHRYNLLDPQWTHAACTVEKQSERMWWWVQNFGVKKKK